MKVLTESGTTYELDGGRVRRNGASGAMRRDNEWLDCYGVFPDPPVVGSPMILLLEPLGDGNVTSRTTTTVMGVVL